MAMAMLIDFSNQLEQVRVPCRFIWPRKPGHVLTTGKRLVGRPRKRKKAPPVPQIKHTDGASKNPSRTARTLRVLIMPVTALVLGLGIIFASAYIRIITVLSRIHAYTPG